MLIELAVAGGMVLLTVMLHGVGLAALGRLLRVEETGSSRPRHSLLSPHGVRFTIAVVLGLFVLHGLEIWLYAGLYHLLGAVGDFRSAVYFSTATYGAIGYSDAGMAEAWRLVGAIEGINGILLMGWSTAFFVTVISRFRL